MFGFMGHLPAKISANYTMPGWIVSLVAFFFNKSSNILLNVICFQSFSTNFHYFSLHFFRHISILNHSFFLCHFNRDKLDYCQPSNEFMHEKL
ncbi:uncharacterized protein Smp_201030 [Schistosoma mansoni]|uniref:uncharacterized protein n=1 Tax=Schistosoma mansoni TaxID=6183 RepID=UPI00022DC272|nr:uncharacterized protein Smp_201030 [Schistosoma mansoni]|eukprot:XP_018648627.1 uncharacterized protein Smp_201030 [Schistosoma mansoni]